MASNSTYEPPKIWEWEGRDGPSLNRPIAGPTSKRSLPQGIHPLQLYSLGTPNGQKVTILLEELLAQGVERAEYDAYLIKIGVGDQFTSGFTALNPNSKIPALFDRETGLRVFESGAILLYLAEKFDAFLSADLAIRTETLNWLFWLQGSAPLLGGGFGHFYFFAPEKLEYPINRFTMEIKRQLDVLDRELSQKPFISGDEYSIADMAIWPWYGQLAIADLYEAAEFLQVASYGNVTRWAQEIAQRPAVQRGCMVNRTSGPLSGQLRERHDASDFSERTEDKING